MKIVQIEPLGITKSQLDNLIKPLVEGGNEYIAYENRETDPHSLAKRVEDADVIVVANQPIPEEVVDKCHNLKLISVAFTGVDHIPINKCKEKGIVVSNAAGYSTNAVAELVFGMLISLYRKINNGVKYMTSSEKLNPGIELCGKTIGIVGTGAIGIKTAEIAKAFGCNIIAYSRTQKECDILTYTSLEDLMQSADIISVHVPLNDSTRGLISAKMIKMMKPNAVLINTARGPIVDNTALARALSDGKIAGAGIDVFDTEPPLKEDYPLLSAPNTVLMPHVGFSTKEALYKRAIITINNIVSWKDGSAQNVVC